VLSVYPVKRQGRRPDRTHLIFSLYSDEIIERVGQALHSRLLTGLLLQGEGTNGRGQGDAHDRLLYELILTKNGRGSQ